MVVQNFVFDPIVKLCLKSFEGDESKDHACTDYTCKGDFDFQVPKRVFINSMVRRYN